MKVLECGAKSVVCLPAEKPPNIAQEMIYRWEAPFQNMSQMSTLTPNLQNSKQNELQCYSSWDEIQ